MSVSDKIGPPKPFAGGWFRCQWLEFNETNLLLETAYKTKKTDWQVAWHGCKLEALYAIMYHGKLIASSDREQGHRFFGGLRHLRCHFSAFRFRSDHAKEISRSAGVIARDSIQIRKDVLAICMARM